VGNNKVGRKRLDKKWTENTVGNQNSGLKKLGEKSKWTKITRGNQKNGLKKLGEKSLNFEPLDWDLDCLVLYWTSAANETVLDQSERK